MMVWLGRAALGACILALAGCSTFTPVPPGPFAAGANYQLTLGRQWTDVSKMVLGNPKQVRILSIDGPILNRLYVTDGLAPGGYIVKPLAKERPTPTYRTGSSPTELVEFVADSVAALDYARVETSGLRPAKFADAEALRFDIKAKTPAGLEVSGAALVCERNGKLYVLLYLAPTEHYFAANLPEVETILGSARMTR